MRKISTAHTATGGTLGARARLRGDQGSVLAEAALMTPLFILLLFGVLEFGGAFRDYLTLGNGSLAGTRQAAIQGNAADADWNIVQAVKKSMNAMPLWEINKVVVYRLSPVGSAPGAGQCLAQSCPVTPVPSSCLSSINGVAGVCNVYGPTELGGQLGHRAGHVEHLSGHAVADLPGVVLLPDDPQRARPQRHQPSGT